MTACDVGILVTPGANNARKVMPCCTHPVLSGKAINNSTLDELIVTDTIPLSVAGLLSENISRISSGQSLNSMFVN